MALTRTQQIDAIRRNLDDQERKVSRDWLNALTQFDSVSIASIARAIESGGTAAILELFSDGVDEFATAVAQESYIAAGTVNAAITAKTLNIRVRFDVTAPEVVNAMRENKARLVQEITQSQRELITKNLVRQANLGANPRVAARELRDNIGLTAYQESAVENYRRLLENGSKEALQRELRDRRSDPLVSRTFDSGGELSQTQINSMVDRYRRRYIKYRTEVIARTESLRSVNSTNEDLALQLDRSGYDVIRQWVTAKDERVRNSHKSMNGQKRKANEAFISGNGNELRWPGDNRAPASETIQCRCVTTIRLAN